MSISVHSNRKDVGETANANPSVGTIPLVSSKLILKDFGANKYGQTAVGRCCVCHLLNVVTWGKSPRFTIVAVTRYVPSILRK